MSNFETQNALTVQNYNAPTAVDAWDCDDPDASPIRGGNVKFADGPYVVGKEKTPLDPTRRFLALDKAGGWLFLKAGCSPEWVMHLPGTPKPERPESDESTWPVGLSGSPECPWRWCHLLYLMDVDSGETLTLSGSTAGMKIAVNELAQQIKSMRNLKPHAIPIIELQSVMMPTKWGSKRRPSLKVISWRTRTTEEVPPEQISGRDYDAEYAEMNAVERERILSF
jgi:hypothetical protein